MTIRYQAAEQANSADPSVEGQNEPTNGRELTGTFDNGFLSPLEYRDYAVQGVR